MKPSPISCLAAILITATAYGTEPPPLEPQFRVDGGFRDAAIENKHLYLLAGEVAAGEPDIRVLRLVEGSEPQQVSSYTARYSPLSLSAGTGWLFLTEGENGLEVVDIRDPAKPRRAAHVPLDGYSHRAVLRGATALVASGFGGLHLVDARDPNRPSPLSSYQAYPSPEQAAEDGVEPAGRPPGDGPAESLDPMDVPSEESGYFRPDDLPAYEGAELEVTAHDIRDREGVLDLAVEGTVAYLA